MTKPPRATISSSSCVRSCCETRHRMAKARDFSAAAKSSRRGQVLRAPPIALLLPATGRRVAKSLTSKAPTPGGPPDLVRRNRDEVGVRQVQLSRSLRAIGEQQRTGLSDALRDAGERLDDAGLVVDLLDRDQCGTGGKRASSALMSIRPLTIDRKQPCTLAHRGARQHHARSPHRLCPLPSHEPRRSRWPRSRRR